MGQFYSDPAREHDPHTLPDAEVFFLSAKEIASGHSPLDFEAFGIEPGTVLRGEDWEGWYYWYCLPGCLPDCEPRGPFKTEEEAISNCRAR